MKGILAAAVLAAGLAGCASTQELTTTRAVSKSDHANCSRAAQKVVDDPNRRNNQTAVVVGSTIGAGLIGLVVASAAQSSDDKALTDKIRNDCLKKRGYKLVPAKPKKEDA